VNSPFTSPEERKFQQWREQGLDIDVETSKLSIFEVKRRIYIQLCGSQEFCLSPASETEIATMIMIIRGRIAQDDQCLDDWITRGAEHGETILVAHVVLKDWTDIKKQRGKLAKPTEFTRETSKVSEKHLEGEPLIVEEFVSPPTSAHGVPSDDGGLSDVRLPPGYNGPVCFWNGTLYILQQYWDGSSPSITLSQEGHSSQTPTVSDTHTANVHPVAPQQPNENNSHRSVAAAPVDNRAANTAAREALRNHLWIAIRLGFLVYILSQNGGFFRCFFLCFIAFLTYLFQSGRIQLHASWRHPDPQISRPSLNVRRSTAGMSLRMIDRLSPTSFLYQLRNSRWIQQVRMICLSFIGSLVPGSPYENNPHLFRDRENPDQPRHDPP
jgi:hypothetical protein